MRQVSGMLRLDLAQYRELAAFAQFGSDLDAATQRQLARGQRLTEILKQHQYAPLTIDKQVVTIFAATNGYLDDLAIEEVRPFERALHQFMDNQRPKLGKMILEKRQIDDELKAALNEAITDFKVGFTEARKK
jgi:F-type H+-transporting ATPase subunit alpha